MSRQRENCDGTVCGRGARARYGEGEGGGREGLRERVEGASVLTDALHRGEGTEKHLQFEEDLRHRLEGGLGSVDGEVHEGIGKLHAHNVVVDRNRIHLQCSDIHILINTRFSKRIDQSLRDTRNDPQMERTHTLLVKSIAHNDRFLLQTLNGLHNEVNRLLTRVANVDDGAGVRLQEIRRQFCERHHIVLLRRIQTQENRPTLKMEAPSRARLMDLLSDISRTIHFDPLIYPITCSDTRTSFRRTAMSSFITVLSRPISIEFPLITDDLDIVGSVRTKWKCF